MATISMCQKCKQPVMWKSRRVGGVNDDGWWNHSTGFNCPKGGDHIARAR